MLRGKIIPSVCFLLAIVRGISPRKSPQLYQERGILSVVNTTSDEVTLNWNLGSNLVKNLSAIRVLHRPTLCFSTPSILRWDRNEKYYVVTDALLKCTPLNFLVPEHYELSRSSVDNAGNEVMIAVKYLEFEDTEYTFFVGMTRVREDGYNVTEVAKTVARTSPDSPPRPVVTGAGCFHVYNVTATSRKVKIYWRREEGDYELKVLEDGWQLYFSRGSLLKGCLWFDDISLKRHSFIFKSCNSAGCSPSTSVHVPAQEELLPLPSSIAFLDQTRNTYVLRWQEPDNVIVASYSVFWIDIFNGTVLYVMEASKNETSIEVKLGRGVNFVALAVSVNSETSSSGIQIPTM